MSGVADSVCGFDSAAFAQSGWSLLNASLTAGSATTADGTAVTCRSDTVDASLGGAQTLGFPSDSSLGGLLGQTTYSSGETFGLVAAEAVSGTNAVPNAAECMYSGDGLGASYSIADCRMIGLDDLDSLCAPAVSELNSAGGTSFSAYAMVSVGATDDATAAGSTAAFELLDVVSPAVGMFAVFGFSSTDTMPVGNIGRITEFVTEAAMALDLASDLSAVARVIGVVLDNLTLCTYVAAGSEPSGYLYPGSCRRRRCMTGLLG